jgi:hypothetical protein
MYMYVKLDNNQANAILSSRLRSFGLKVKPLTALSK